MNKVLVDPAALEEAAKWLEVHSASPFSAEAFAADALREAIAQPAEAEGVELRRYTPISQGYHIPAMNSCDQGRWVRHSDHLAALSAVTAEVEALRRDAERYRWLRMADWWNSPLCVIRYPKQQAKPGTDCPSRDRLDAAVDDAMQQS